MKRIEQKRVAATKRTSLLRQRINNGPKSFIIFVPDVDPDGWDEGVGRRQVQKLLEQTRFADAGIADLAQTFWKNG